MAEVSYRMAERADLLALCSLINDANRADNVPQVVTVQEIAEEIDDAGDLEANVRLAVAGTGLVGYVRTMHLPSDELWERCYLIGAVHADQRGRGIGRTLMAWAIERGTDQLRSSTNLLPKYLRVEVGETTIAARQLFERLGFTEARKFEELLRPLTDLPLLRDAVGVRIERWPEDRDEEILHVKNAAFADHWGSTPTRPHSWKSMVRGFGSYSAQSFIALNDDDRVVGFSLNHRTPSDDELLGRCDGWIHNLGTLPEWRGRGIASALIIRSLHAFAAAGLTHASIGVDSDSLTGAIRLYKSLGFERNRRHSTLEIAL
jgi:mycothiol synthase